MRVDVPSTCGIRVMDRLSVSNAHERILWAPIKHELFSAQQTRMLRLITISCAKAAACQYEVYDTNAQLAHLYQHPIIWYCFQCEQKSHLIHDPYHVFLKLPRPVDRPIESPHPVIPVVYSEPAGGHYRGPEPRAYLQGLRHSNALCDLCSSTIVGEWFRCIMCGKDYCDECESIGGHDPTHIFVVFKSKVDTQLIGAITDLTLSKPPPIWPHEVYLS
ncbi:unnamed protein product [Rhizoctonia solani]|uniref:ZZ-type domain-containing protein n=1 Tax=Rhizoctonia solani TaxID=456999 RepID=A0A8H3D263_9AGAM|nr:unnamed protein product [Rhizoctonia solani]